MKKDLPFLMFIIAILAYSVAAMAYMHKSFAGKDIINMIQMQLERIELKLDKIGERE